MSTPAQPPPTPPPSDTGRAAERPHSPAARDDLLDEHLVNMDVDEAVEAMDRALVEDQAVPAGPDTPCAGRCWNGGARTCERCGQR